MNQPIIEGNANTAIATVIDKVIEVKPTVPLYLPKEIDVDSLRHRCHQDINEFFNDPNYGVTHHCQNGLKYVFKDNGPESKMLAVAHLDTVQSKKSFAWNGNKVYLPQLDDRLGVYMILDRFYDTDLKFDILLTEGEETGNSTAKFFNIEKEYNLIFEIDRRGIDPVMYKYDHPDYRKLLEEYGFKVWSTGSFTDIVHLSQFGVLGVNFACAYYNNHDLDAYVNLEELDELVPKIYKFLLEQQNNKLPILEKPKPNFTYPSQPYQQHWGGYRDYAHNTGWDGDTNYEILTPESEYCLLCVDKTCPGIQECSICRSAYHKSTFLKNFGVCYSCVTEYFDIDKEDADKLLDLDLEERTKTFVTSYILSVLGGRYVFS